MERLTKRSNKTVHDNGVCCTHFNGFECSERMGECTDNCPWEEAVWSKLADYEDKQEQGLLPILMPNDIIWDIDWGKPKSWIITAFSFGCAYDYIDIPEECENEMAYYYKNYSGSITGSFASSEIGKSIFLTKAEAEEALAKMGGKE